MISKWFNKTKSQRKLFIEAYFYIIYSRFLTLLFPFKKIINITKLKTDLENFAFFLDINDKYIVIQNVPKEIIQSRLEGKLSFQLYKKGNTQEAIIAFGTTANQ